MKKIVPDPPHSIPPQKNATGTHYVIQSHLTTEDALVLASEMLRGALDTTDEYCRAHFKAPGQGMLVNVLHCAETARTLIEHALTKLQADERQETKA